MKKPHLSNFSKLLIAVLALLIFAAGGTYAWFTASSQTTHDVSLGALRVAMNIPVPEVSSNYEPGTNVELPGTISNKGSLPSITRIQNNSQIKFAYSDNNLTPIPSENRKFISTQKKAIQLDFKPTSHDYFDNSGAYWFTDNDGQTYVLLDPGTTVNVKAIVNFNGNEMGNMYQNADIKISLKNDSTQVIDDAMKHAFGVTDNDLIPLENPTMGISRYTTSGHTKAERALSHLHALAVR